MGKKDNGKWKSDRLNFLPLFEWYPNWTDMQSWAKERKDNNSINEGTQYINNRLKLVREEEDVRGKDWF